MWKIELLFSVLHSIQRELFISTLAMASWWVEHTFCPLTLGLAKENSSRWDRTEVWRKPAIRLFFLYISDPPWEELPPGDCCPVSVSLRINTNADNPAYSLEPTIADLQPEPELSSLAHLGQPNHSPSCRLMSVRLNPWFKPQCLGVVYYVVLLRQ